MPPVASVIPNLTVVRVTQDYANFRRSYARSYAETYEFAPPSTVYGMLLSLVGQFNRHRHVNARLAFAYRSIPQKSLTMHKLTRYKYGVSGKQGKKGNVPEMIETVSDLDFLVAIESSQEVLRPHPTLTLAAKVRQAIEHPEQINRTGVLCLGLSDNMVNAVEIYRPQDGDVWHRLLPSSSGTIDLPVWVDHATSHNSKWQRFTLDEAPILFGHRPDGKLDWLESEHFVSIRPDAR